MGRAIKNYDLVDLNDDLRYKRINDSVSLRELAKYVNRRTLEAAISDGGIDLTDVAYGAVSSDDALSAVYETISSDGIAADRKARVRKRLEQHGVDIRAIESDWVTHPTVRSHLNDCLGIETSRSARITPDDSRDTIEWARTRCTRIVEQTISRLVASGHITLSEFDVSISVKVECFGCGRTYRPAELLNQRSCVCDVSEMPESR